MNGSVVTFGDANYGGDSSIVFENLSSNVVYIIASASVFIAIKKRFKFSNMGQKRMWWRCIEN
jgi:hypothetical protein